MYAFISKIVTHIEHLIMPSFCAYCKQWLSTYAIFCAECKKTIQPLVSQEVFITPAKRMHVYAISPYQEPLKSLILAKAQSNRLASKQLGVLLWELTPLKNIDFDYIVPVPLHWTRYAYRGYNQAEVIAEVIACASKKPVIHLLKRKRRTVFQSTLHKEERYKNLDDAFVLTTKDFQRYYNKNILLVDDLMTGGATLKNAAKKLLLLQPATINAAVACRVV